MTGWTKVFLRLALVASLCASVSAQAPRTLNFKLLNGKTGEPIMATGFMVRINHQVTIHYDWIKQDEDGNAVLTLPADAEVISIHASYNRSMDIYVNCDALPHKGVPGENWYKVADIFSAGTVAPNVCFKGTHKSPEAAKPGEMTFYVREMNWKEQASE